jgi:hypothetical protein
MMCIFVLSFKFFLSVFCHVKRRIPTYMKLHAPMQACTPQIYARCGKKNWTHFSPTPSFAKRRKKDHCHGYDREGGVENRCSLSPGEFAVPFLILYPVLSWCHCIALIHEYVVVERRRGN